MRDEDWVYLLKSELTYDPSSGHLWWVRKNGPSSNRKLDKPAGCIDCHGYIVITLRKYGKSKLFKGHRVAWLLHYGVWPEGSIDHINADRKDNRIENLRIASHKQNGMNRKKQKGGSSSLYKGVSWYQQTKRWKSYIRLGKSTVHLGYYLSEVDAAKAYDSAAKKYFGDYALLNFKNGEVNAENP